MVGLGPKLGISERLSTGSASSQTCFDRRIVGSMPKSDDLITIKILQSQLCQPHGKVAIHIRSENVQATDLAEFGFQIL